jgi:hypothetical protein
MAMRLRLMAVFGGFVVFVATAALLGLVRWRLYRTGIITDSWWIGMLHMSLGMFAGGLCVGFLIRYRSFRWALGVPGLFLVWCAVFWATSGFYRGALSEPGALLNAIADGLASLVALWLGSVSGQALRSRRETGKKA